MSVKTNLDKKHILLLPEEHSENIKKYGVAKLGLFGSAVRNKHTPDSDLDFLVEFKEGEKSYNNFIQLALYLEELFDQKVDLVTKKALSNRIKQYINKEIEYVSLNS